MIITPQPIKSKKTSETKDTPAQPISLVISARSAFGQFSSKAKSLITAPQQEENTFKP